MTKFLPTVLLSIALAGIGASIVSAQSATDAPVAQEDRAGERMLRDGRGRHRGDRARGGHEMIRGLFSEADADDDGTLTTQEIDAFRSAKVGEADVSGDGAVSLDEFQTLYAEAMRERMVDAFQAIDANGDGSIDAEELDARIARIIERMDRDGDGALTLGRGRRG